MAVCQGNWVGPRHLSLPGCLTVRERGGLMLADTKEATGKGKNMEKI